MRVSCTAEADRILLLGADKGPGYHRSGACVWTTGAMGDWGQTTWGADPGWPSSSGSPRATVAIPIEPAAPRGFVERVRQMGP